MNGGDFPEINHNDFYKYNNYKYTYDSSLGGWKVEVLDKNLETYDIVLESIADKAIVSMNSTFQNCSNLKSLPEGFTIPDTVSDLTNLFSHCKNLQGLPDSFVVPASVKSMEHTFSYCTSLKATLKVNANPTNTFCCLFGIDKDWISNNILIEGSCSEDTKFKIAYSVTGAFWDL